MDRKIKGETLIESLISMFFITVILVPMSNILLKTYDLSKKIDERNIIVENNKNMLELLKTKTYLDLLKLVGKYEINNNEEFYNKFFIRDKYRILTINPNIKRNIEIIKSDKFYFDNNGKKKFFLELKINNVKEVYRD